jgi:CDP-diacylglycerol--glycerol-3-phosphate 3-phosphatidyltransferase
MLVKNVPNYITSVRLILVPVFVLLMANPTPFSHFLAVAVFIIAALTDFLDGIIARRFAVISDFGKMLDPLADKLLVMAALVMLVGKRDGLFGDPWVPAWMVFLVLAREIWITGMRGVAASRGVVVAANNSGKVKNVLQVVSIVFLLLHHPKLEVAGAMVTFQVIGLYLLLFSILVSYWGAYGYTVSIFRLAGFLPSEGLQHSDANDESPVARPPGRVD